MIRNPYEDDESPDTCCDCNAEMPSETMYRNVKGIVRQILVCRECFDQFPTQGCETEDAEFEHRKESA